MTKQEIKAKIAEVKAKINVMDYPNTEEIQLVKSKMVGLQKKLNDLTVAFREQNKEELLKLHREYTELEIELDRVEVSKKLVLSYGVEEWFKEIGGGIHNSYKWEVEWVDEKEEYVIYKVPGSTDWNGIGNTSYYPTQHILIKVGSKWGDNIGGFEGRGSKKKFDELKKKLME